MVAQVISYLPVVGAIALALPALCGALIVFFMAVPGPQPEKFLEEQVKPVLEKIAELIGKFSRK